MSRTALETIANYYASGTTLAKPGAGHSSPGGTYWGGDLTRQVSTVAELIEAELVFDTPEAVAKRAREDARRAARNAELDAMYAEEVAEQKTRVDVLEAAVDVRMATRSDWALLKVERARLTRMDRPQCWCEICG